MSILNEILAVKRKEIAELAQSDSLEDLRAKNFNNSRTPSFANALTSCPAPAIIAEIKRASPSRGMIRADLDPISTARDFARAGAACLSVLTDEQFFKGTADFIPQIKSSLADQCPPILRKDFIIDALQVWQSKQLGADAILLIVAALEKNKLTELCFEAQRAGLDVLIEIHNEQELNLLVSAAHDSKDFPAFLLGINNRDLHTFTTDLNVTKALAQNAVQAFQGREIVIVSESGIFKAEDAQYLYQNGADALLIGESLVAEGEPGENLKLLIEGFRK